MNNINNDQELLESFKNPATKEWAFTGIIKKYQERLYWHIRRMVQMNHLHFYQLKKSGMQLH